MVLMKLSAKEFDRSFRRGLGRAYMHVKENKDHEVKEIILKYTLKNPCYDTQCEPSRASWIMEVIDLTDNQEFYANEIIEHLCKSHADSDRDISQLYDLCMVLAKRGNKEAENAIYTRFAKQELNEAFLGGDHIIHLKGLDGLLHVASILGNRMIADEEYWDGSTYSFACEEFSKKTVDAFLTKHAENDPAISEYFKKSLEIHQLWQNHPKEKSLEERREFNRKELPFDSILASIENLENGPLSKYLRFGNFAEPEELEIIYNKMLSENRREQLLRYLSVFRRKPFPKMDDKLLSLVKSEDKEISDTAIFSLSNLKHSMLRDLLTELFEGQDKGLFFSALSLFEKNYRQGDYIFIEALLNASGYSDEELDRFCYSVLRIFEENPEKGMQKCLVWVYENILCAHCRGRAVELMLQNDIMPHHIFIEGCFDSYEKTVEICKSRQA